MIIEKYKPGITATLWSLLHKDHIKDLVVFCRQLSVLVETGVPLVESLGITKEQMENPRFRKSVDIVGSQVRQGFTLAEACRQHPEIFPEVFVHTIEAGETLGKLEKVLDKLSAYYEDLVRKREKTKNAMIYPIILVVVVFFVVSFLVIRVLPTLADMFLQSYSNIPLPTKVLLFLSANYVKFLGLILAVILGTFTVFTRFYKSERGLFIYNKKLLYIPIFGELKRKVITARLCRILSLLIENGIPIIKALELASKTVENVFIKGELAEIITGLQNGGTFGKLLNHEVFPAMMIKMVTVGEETRTLEEMLNKTATFFESEVDFLEERIISLIEPTIIMFMAIIIGFVVIGILLPMMDMYNYY